MSEQPPTNVTQPAPVAPRSRTRAGTISAPISVITPPAQQVQAAQPAVAGPPGSVQPAATLLATLYGLRATQQTLARVWEHPTQPWPPLGYGYFRLPKKEEIFYSGRDSPGPIWIESPVKGVWKENPKRFKPGNVTVCGTCYERAMKSCKGVQYGLTIDRKNSGAIYDKNLLCCDGFGGVHKCMWVINEGTSGHRHLRWELDEGLVCSYAAAPVTSIFEMPNSATLYGPTEQWTAAKGRERITKEVNDYISRYNSRGGSV